MISRVGMMRKKEDTMNITRTINGTAVTFTVSDTFVSKLNVPFLVTDRESYLLAKAMENDKDSGLTTDSDEVNEAIANLKELREKADTMNRKVTVETGVEFDSGLTTFAVTKNGAVFKSGLDKAGVLSAFDELETKYEDPRRRIRILPSKDADADFVAEAAALEDVINDGISEGDIRRVIGVYGTGKNSAVIGISKKAVRKERHSGEFADTGYEEEPEE